MVEEELSLTGPKAMGNVVEISMSSHEVSLAITMKMGPHIATSYGHCSNLLEDTWLLAVNERRCMIEKERMVLLTVQRYTL